MASPHVAADLLQPLGMLTPGLFPQFDDADDLDTFFETLLADGYERADDADVTGADQQDKRDRIAIAFAYYRAYDAIWQRMSSTPATAHIEGEASRTFLASQIATFETLKNDWFVAYEGLLPIAVTSSNARIKNTSGSLPITYGW